MTLCKHTPSKSIIKRLHQTCISVQELYDQTARALLSKDTQLANSLLDSTITLENSWKLANEKSEISGLALSYSHLLIDDLEQVQHYATEIAEITIDRAETERA